MNRRQLLKGGLAGGAVVAGGLLTVDRIQREEAPPPDAPTPSTPPGTPEEPGIRLEDEYETVVDMVEAGADPEGEEPINGVLEAEAGDDTLLSFPAGTYRIGSTEVQDHSHLALAAMGEERPTIVSDGESCISGAYLYFRGVSDLLLDRVDFNLGVEGSGGSIRIDADGDATVRDVSAWGSCSDQIALFRMDITDEEGTGLIERFHAENRDRDPALTCVFVGKPHAGEIVFRDCELYGFSDNGLYASAPGLPDGRDGVVKVEGGRYQNNNVANVRLGSTGSTARGVQVVCNDPPTTSQSVNLRGIRLRAGSEQIVEDCDVHIADSGGDSFGGVVFHQENAGAAVRNSTIRIDKDTVPAIRAFPHTEAEDGLVFEDLTITGDAAGLFSAVLEGRDGTIFRNCTIEAPGPDRGGIRMSYSNNCRIEQSTIDVTGDPIVIRQSSARIVDTTIVTPDGERHIDEMDAEDEDFTPR